MATLEDPIRSVDPKYVCDNFVLDEDIFSHRYHAIIKKVDHEISGKPEYDPELIQECNSLCGEIDHENFKISIFLRNIYRLKFPGLIFDPVDYARAVKQIGNEAIDACDRAISLDADKKRIQDFVATRIRSVAPNLSIVVGTSVAAKLMGAVGGLSELAKVSACDILLLGADKKFRIQAGYLEETEIFEDTPSFLKKLVRWLLAEKTMLAARVDFRKSDPMGVLGRSLFEEIKKRIQRWQQTRQTVPAKQLRKTRRGSQLRKMMSKMSLCDAVPEKRFHKKIGLNMVTKFKRQGKGNDHDHDQTTSFSATDAFSKMSIQDFQY